MVSYKVHENTQAALQQFELPDKLGFGLVPAPVMYWAEYMDGIWDQGTLEASRPIQLQPSAKVLHYGQEIFEGMKAYRVGTERAGLFRPADNWRRFNLSAQRMAMPEIPEALFMEGIYAVTACCEPLIPGQRGQSLYLRPFMFASEPSLEVSGANRFAYMVIASPSEAIHAGAMKVLIERDYTRAALGGTGAAKTGGNYASSFASRRHAQSLGFDQSLWLDPKGRKNIEELSVMNFFAVIEGEIHTPELTGSLLEGITRSSLIELAQSMGIKVHQRAIDIDQLIADIASGRCSEVFCCGTAAIVSPISCLGENDGTRYELGDQAGEIAHMLKEKLLDIQERKTTDQFGWTRDIPTEYYPQAG